MQVGSVIQVLPQLRQVPKTFIWSLYGAFAIGVTIAVIVLSYTPDNQPTASNPEDDTYKTRIFLGPESRRSNKSSPHTKKSRVNIIVQTPTAGNEFVTLEEVVAYECYFEAGIKNVSWLEGSNDEVTYRDAFGHYKSTNVSEEPRQHVSTIQNCHRDQSERMCRLYVRVLSSASEKELPVESGAVERRFFRLAQGRVGDYTYTHEERGDTLNHSCRYVARMPSVVSNVTGWNTCVIKSLEVYDYSWTSKWFQPKFTFSIMERCPSHSLAWTDTYVFNKTKLRRAPANLTLPLDLLRRRPAKRKATVELPPSDVGTEDNTTHTGDYNKGSRSFDYRSLAERATRDVSAIVHRHVEEDLAKSPRRLIYPNYTTSNYQGFGGQMEWTRLSTLRKRRSVRKNVFEPIDIADTGWVLHGIIQYNDTFQRNTVNLAVSKKETLTWDRENTNSSWMPRSGEIYKPLLTSDLYVTRILKTRINEYDETIAYFIAAPVGNFSRKFLYQIKIVYPPLEFPALEPVQCLTCPDGPRGSPLSSNEGSRNLSGSGFSPKCIWAYVLMSYTARNYILHCMGPETPWTAIVSTLNNTVIRHFSLIDEELRWRYNTFVQPKKIEFEVELNGKYRGRARLHLPPGVEEGKCEEKVRLLLRVARKPDEQLVNARFELSLTTYLTTVKRFAVLCIDARASRFQTLEFTRLRFRRRESMQLADYVRAAIRAATESTCIDEKAGFGVFGDGYGGHVALNLVAGENEFQCAAAVEPFTPWPLYVYPFTEKPLGVTEDLLRWRMFLQRYVIPLSRRLRSRNFSIHTSSRPKHTKHTRDYTNALLTQLIRQGIEFEHQTYADTQCVTTRLELYERLANYFEHCFAREKNS